MLFRLPVLLPALLALTASAQAESPVVHAELPPALEWQGASRSLALDPNSDDPWITPSEKSALTTTPTYDETVEWLGRLVEATPLLHKVSLGKSAEQRDVWMVIASADASFTPEALRAAKKPVVLVQAGIHSGEIDGKDAGLMLLRDLAFKGDKKKLLDRVNWLFVPIFNVDGHERRTPFGRVNQRGPEQMGWRTNARNQNLNRDYAKADTPAMRAMLRAIEAYDPDLYVDVHVTDGIDYQYDITWGYMGDQGYSPAISQWLEQTLDPPVIASLEASGHIPGYLVFAGDNDNPDGMLFKWSAATPRYSDGYGGARHLPTILVENHSLKPYAQRVLGTYVLIESILGTVGSNAESLIKAIEADRDRRPETVTLGWTVDRAEAPEEVSFKGVAWKKKMSEAAGAEVVEWLGEPVTQKLLRVDAKQPVKSVRLPNAWWVPAAWPEVIERLRLHGIRTEPIADSIEVEVELYRVHGAKTASEPFEGHVRVELQEEPEIERLKVTYAAGSVRVPSDQPLADLAALLLEPESSDSFFQWGFFSEILSRTEYVEGYVMGPTADQMLAADPALKARFEAILKDDPEFAGSPNRRLEWFYRQTGYHDSWHLLYPVGREVTPR